VADRLSDYDTAVQNLGKRLRGELPPVKPAPSTELPTAPLLMPNGEPETRPAMCPTCAAVLVVTRWEVKRLRVDANGVSTLKEHRVAAGRHCPSCRTSEREFIARGVNLYRKTGRGLIEEAKKFVPEVGRGW
jgi:hypothetical protein